ncbi:hypothetical protein JRQ81_007201 [Phrynocephalus forsythii]|uniref:Uncharacterized protein n=1 Tax=Phrynocephalus forsythii TaxID=171643 RepID=A0A9Q1ATL4_9SAUR|nr:hypothetical protein JRQ81_007201 [Phrynocephalus forsythii]
MEHRSGDNGEIDDIVVEEHLDDATKSELLEESGNNEKEGGCDEEMDTGAENSSGVEFEQPESIRSKEVAQTPETPQRRLLDFVFGQLPPTSLIKIEPLFPKPPHPQRRPPTKQPLFVTEAGEASEERSQEAATDAQKQDKKEDILKKRFFRIGGMLVLPVPVDAPLFTDEK